MAKKAGKQKSFEEALWDSATKLRGSVASPEYKHIVLSLIFLNLSNLIGLDALRGWDTDKGWILSSWSQIVTGLKHLST